MITSFDVRRFRCFERLSLKDLAAINIVVGDNASGKTALLEALLVSAHAHPVAATILRIIRNRSVPSLPQGTVWSGDLFHSLWDDLFFNFDHSLPIEANFTDSKAGEYGVTIKYKQLDSVPAFSAFGSIPALSFTRFVGQHEGKRPNSETILRINEQGAPVFEGETEMAPAVYLLPSTVQFYTENLVDFFSALSRENREIGVIEAMQREFPFIENISVLKEITESTLWVTTESPRRKFPLTVVSAGVGRYLNILLALASERFSVLLVDEIENGIYWKIMPGIWQTLRHLCVERGMQLFATTHSNECLQSLIGAMQGHEEHFSLLRTIVDEDGTHSVEHFTGKPFLAALEGRGEVR